MTRTAGSRHVAMSKTILLVEDERIQAIVQQQTLSEAGFTVLHAATGEDAVEQICHRETGVDLVLMDIDLGAGIDGTEAARRIQQCSQIPILFLSSHTEPEYVERTQKIGSYGYVVKNSGDVVLIASINMAFRLHEALQTNRDQAAELRQARTRLEELNYLMTQVIEQNPWSVAVFDRDMNFRYVSETFQQDFRAIDRELVGRNNYEVFPEVPQRWRDMHQRVLQGAVEWSDNDTIEYPDGTTDRTQWECRPWYTPERDIGGVILYSGLLPDTPAEYEGTGTSLHYLADLRRYRAIEQEGLDIIYTVTAAGVFSYASPNISATLGYSAEEVVGQKFTFLMHPDDLTVLRAWWAEVEKAGAIHRSAEYRVVAKDGSIRWHQLSGRLTDNPHEELIGICRDITELKETEENLRAAITERDTVFRELKHRTRNSLSVISSLLSLESASEPNADASDTIARARSRVRAILAIYEKLDVRTPGLTVDLAGTIKDIARKTIDVFRHDRQQIALESDVPTMEVDSRTAATLGLIVNEAVTNAMKHAFGSGRDGQVVLLGVKHPDALYLTIEDNGGSVDSRGVAEAGPVPTASNTKDPGDAHGFGQQLISDLAAQLEGSVSFTDKARDSGTSGYIVTVTVPYPPASDAR
ncbi:MAG: PAS domain S-box protein [Spirochaetaceae bacterium]|nr:MAG: PAS domain S-box protein [Spirochaetaceae bacterium]